MLPAMKGMFIFSAVILLLSLGACSVAEQDASAVGQKFQEGIQGRGSIVPNDPTQDSFGAEYR